jgi:NADPH:quinone reductase-like Zn-dependent oxidoreductase
MRPTPIKKDRGGRLYEVEGITMKAIVSTGYGPPEVLQLQEVEKPKVKDNEVSVKIVVTTVTRADGMMRTGKPYFARLFLGFTKPRNSIPGGGFAGRVDAVGREVTQFKVGDKVFGETAMAVGANAEYVAVPADGLIEKTPEAMTDEQAAAMCDGPVTAMNFLKELAKIQPGQSVLINGASGSVGSAAVQLAKHFGASVTGVCSAANVDLVKSLGAERVIDYGQEDFTASVRNYDIIFDTVGTSSFSRCKGALKKGGVFISPVLGIPLLFQMLWTLVIGDKKAKFSATGLLPVPKRRVLLNGLVPLFEAGTMKTLIDRRYPLGEVPEAHRYVDRGRKKGNVIITMEAADNAAN